MLLFFIMIFLVFTNCYSIGDELHQLNEKWLAAVRNGDEYQEKLVLIKMRHLQAKENQSNNIDQAIANQSSRTEQVIKTKRNSRAHQMSLDAALFGAARNGDTQAALRLVSKNADINAKDAQGQSILEIAKNGDNNNLYSQLLFRSQS